jgi:hypothetical protein
MIRCNVTVSTAEGTTSYSGLFSSTTRAAFDAAARFGMGCSIKVRALPR